MDSSIKMNDTLSLGIGITATAWDSHEISAGCAPGLRGIGGASLVACEPVWCTPLAVSLDLPAPFLALAPSPAAVEPCIHGGVFEAVLKPLSIRSIIDSS